LRAASVDLAHGNIRELGEFTGATDLPASLARLLEWGVGAWWCTWRQGAGWFNGDELVVEPPAPIQRQGMATGTGDVLSVCLMLMHHRPDIPCRKTSPRHAVVADSLKVDGS